MLRSHTLTDAIETAEETTMTVEEAATETVEETDATLHTQHDARPETTNTTRGMKN